MGNILEVPEVVRHDPAKKPKVNLELGPLGKWQCRSLIQSLNRQITEEDRKEYTLSVNRFCTPEELHCLHEKCGDKGFDVKQDYEEDCVNPNVTHYYVKVTKREF